MLNNALVFSHYKKKQEKHGSLCLITSDTDGGTVTQMKPRTSTKSSTSALTSKRTAFYPSINFNNRQCSTWLVQSHTAQSFSLDRKSLLTLPLSHNSVEKRSNHMNTHEGGSFRDRDWERNWERVAPNTHIERLNRLCLLCCLLGSVQTK